jgi:two-component system, OmpR family, response regulator VicR
MVILIVEDDPTISEVIGMTFEIRWPDVKIVSITSGQQAIEIVEKQHPDLMILDLGLPDIDGFEVLKEVRLFSTVPIIIITARDEEKDIVKALERGADDYIIKPFRQLELMARAQALLRRAHLVSQACPDVYGQFRFGQSIHNLFVDKREIRLTTTEGTIMSHLIRNAEKVVPVSNLAEAVWGSNYPGSHEAVRVYIRRLRKKIETDPENPQYIHTRPGLGYILQGSN